MPRRTNSLLLALASFALANAQPIPPDEIRSQTVAYAPPSSATFRTELRAVEVPVVVRDGLLHAVGGLTRDDFEIFDNGNKQAITAFSVDHFTPRGDAALAAGSKPNTQPRPRFIALCFDDIHLLPAALNPLKEAGKKFVRNSLASDDRAVVVRTTRSENVKFTNDVSTLAAQIEKIAAPVKETAGEMERCPHIGPDEAYQIANSLDPGGLILHAKMAECLPCYQHECADREVISKAEVLWARVRRNTANSLGVIDSLVDGMAKLPGQRIIVLTSGGFLTGTLEADVDRLMEKARRAEIVISGLDARALSPGASAGTAYDGLGVLASGTGGTFFHNNNNMDLGFRELGMRPETSYLLAFAPPNGSDGKFHNLRVRLARENGYSVEARLGYTAATASASDSAAPVSKLDTAAMASNTVADLPVSFTWEQWTGPPALATIVHIDFNLLHFRPNGDRQSQRIVIIADISDSSGNFVTGKRSVLELNLRKATFDRLAKGGFTTALTIKVPPGSYSVRAAAEDALDSKVAAASGTIEVR